MTGQCGFLRKFPNFLRKQGISAHSVYPPLCLPASLVSLPHPSSLNHLFNFNQTKGKGLMDMTALWVLREDRSAVRKDPNYCSLPQKEPLGNISTTTTHSHQLLPHGWCQLTCPFMAVQTACKITWGDTKGGLGGESSSAKVECTEEGHQVRQGCMDP